MNVKKAGIWNQLWRVLIGIFCTSLAGIFGAIAGCSPLPGNSFDPVYLYLHGTPTASKPSEESTKKITQSRTENIPTGQTEIWAGRYQDSRGGGEIMMALIRGTMTTSGTWRLRTGGGGPVSIIGGNGQQLQLRMENIGRECPAVFEGAAELSEALFTGTYHGKDCDGAVSNGRLELRPR